MKGTDMSNRAVETAQRAVQWLVYWTKMKQAGVKDTVYVEDKADRAVKELLGEKVTALYDPPPAVFCDWCGAVLSGDAVRVKDLGFCSTACSASHKNEFRY
jgi:hypothetical protein